MSVDDRVVGGGRYIRKDYEVVSLGSNEGGIGGTRELIQKFVSLGRRCAP